MEEVSGLPTASSEEEKFKTAAIGPHEEWGCEVNLRKIKKIFGKILSTTEKINVLNDPIIEKRNSPQNGEICT